MPTVAFSIGGEPLEIDALQSWAVANELRGRAAAGDRRLADAIELRLIGASSRPVTLTARETVTLYIAVKAVKLGVHLPG